jgi:hypothetical protein
MWGPGVLLLCFLSVFPCHTLIVRELESLIYTTEEVDIRRIEKHVGLWNFDLERHTGKGAKLEALMAARLMRESTLLARSLMGYASRSGVSTGVFKHARERVSVGSSIPSPAPLLSTSKQSSPGSKGVGGSETSRVSWAGERVVVEPEQNGVRRVKRNIFGEILHQLTGVATDAELQQQLKVDEEIRDQLAVTLTRQVAYERDLTNAIGNMTVEEDKLAARVSEMADKHEFDLERSYRMSAHRFILMEDVDQLEDILEAVVTGAVNSRHAVYLSAKAGLSHVASFAFLNLTESRHGVTVTYLSRLFHEVEAEEAVVVPPYHLLSTAAVRYYLHSSHDLSLPLTEEETRATRVPCDTCAIIVHLGMRKYLVARSGELTCTVGGRPAVTEEYQMGSTLYCAHEDVCQNDAMIVSNIGLHVTRVSVVTSGEDPLGALVLKRKTSASSRLSGAHEMSTAHAALNLRLRQNVGAAQADIERMVTETQQSFDSLSFSSYSTYGWLGVISIIVCTLLCLIILQCCKMRREMRRDDNTVVFP